MDIAQAQREHLQKWRMGSEASGIWLRSRNEAAFVLIGTLNIAAFLKLELIKAKATKQAIDGWARWSSRTISGRWTSGALEWLGAKATVSAQEMRFHEFRRIIAGARQDAEYSILTRTSS